MSLVNVQVFINIHGDPSIGIFSLQDRIEIRWDLDEVQGDRERVRDILGKAWSELYDGVIDVHFGDECADCLGVGYHKASCPSASSGNEV